MTRLVISRVAAAGLTLLLAVTIAFLLTRVAGDPVRNLLGITAPEEQVQRVRAELGMTQPLFQQWLDYIGGLLRGDLGDSLQTGQSNLETVLQRLQASFQLGAAAMLIAVVIGIPLGILSAWHEGSRLDRALTSISLVGQSVPAFWLGLMAILIFAVNLGWFPAGGYGSADNLILPAATLALLPLAQLARLTRSAAVEVLHEPFMTAAQARGVPTRTLVLRHLVRNVMLPVLSLIGLQVGGLLSGAVTVEIVFGWPGMGALAVQAVQFRDFPLVQAIVVVGAFLFVVVNLVVDLLYGLIDPRIRVTT